MAVGDIKKFGMLQATLNGRNINLRRVNSNSAPLWDAEGYTNFTIVENTTGLDAYNIEWIEDRYNGKSVYISKNALFLDMRAKDYLANINKKIKINNKTYLIKGIEEAAILWTNSSIYRISENILNLMDLKENSSFTLATTTSYSLYGEIKYKTLYWNSNEWVDGTSYSYNQGNTNSGTFIYLIETNTAPEISGYDEDLGEKNSSFSINYSVNDVDGDEITVTESINGEIINTIKNPTYGSNLTCTIPEQMFSNLSVGTTNTIEIEATDGTATSYRRYTFIKTNSAPLINYSGQSDLGQLTSKPTITYSVSDNEGDTITVTEKLNGEVIREFTATSNTNYTITLTDEFWLTCGKNTNTIEIAASDVNGGTSYKYITFTRQVNKVQITTKNPIETDVAATKIMVSPDWDKTGCTGRVEVCNNGFDENPTWEDMTTMATLNRPYVFTNSTKTANKWGIKIRLTLTKNEGYTGEVAIYGFGGAFE